MEDKSEDELPKLKTDTDVDSDSGDALSDRVTHTASDHGTRFAAMQPGGASLRVAGGVESALWFVTFMSLVSVCVAPRGVLTSLAATSSGTETGSNEGTIAGTVAFVSAATAWALWRRADVPSSSMDSKRTVSAHRTKVPKGGSSFQNLRPVSEAITISTVKMKTTMNPTTNASTMTRILTRGLLMMVTRKLLVGKPCRVCVCVCEPRIHARARTFVSSSYRSAECDWCGRV